MFSSRMLLVVFAFVSCSSAFNVAKVQPKVKMITYMINCIGTEDTCDGDVLVESFRQIILLKFMSLRLNSLAQATVSSRRLIF